MEPLYMYMYVVVRVRCKVLSECSVDADVSV